MLLDKIGLLYEPSLILVHDLRLVLMILCEQPSLLIIQIACKLLAFTSFHSFGKEW